MRGVAFDVRGFWRRLVGLCEAVADLHEQAHSALLRHFGPVVLVFGEGEEDVDDEGDVRWGSGLFAGGDDGGHRVGIEDLFAAGGDMGVVVERVFWGGLLLVCVGFEL